VFAHGGLFRGPDAPGSRGAGSFARPSAVGGAEGPPANPGGLQTDGASTPAGRPFPGGGPEIPFSEDRWEFWWEFNHDRYTALRESLITSSATGGTGFVLPSETDRTQVILPALLRTLRDKDDQVRSASNYALARLGVDSVFSYIQFSLLEDPSLLVRTHALLAAGQARIPKAAERLNDLLWDRKTPDELRAFAAVSLGVLKTPQAATMLRDALAAPSEGNLPYTVRLAATYALGITEDSANAPFLRTQAMDQRADVNLLALRVLALGRVGDRAANSILIQALRSHETQVRRSAAIALGAVARAVDLDVVKSLQQAAETDSDRMVRNLSDLSLGRIAAQGAPKIVEKLRSRFHSVSSGRRAFVALALGISQDETAVKVLRSQLVEGSNSLRGAAAVALGLLGKTDVVPLLRSEFRKQKDPTLRAYLAYALGKLGDHEVRPDLRHILEEEKSPLLLRWSALALGLLGDTSVVPRLMRLIENGGEQLTRASLVHALGLIGDRHCIEFLIGWTTHAKETDLVRAVATYALGMLCDDQAEPLPALYSRDHNYTLRLQFIPELFYLF
jgi:HEAT repeat protein